MGQTWLQLRTSQGTDSSLNKAKIILGVLINLHVQCSWNRNMMLIKIITFKLYNLVKLLLVFLGTFIDNFYSSTAKILLWWKNQFFVQNQLRIYSLSNRISMFTSIWTNCLKGQPRLSHSCKYYSCFFFKAIGMATSGVVNPFSSSTSKFVSYIFFSSLDVFYL